MGSAGIGVKRVWCSGYDMVYSTLQVPIFRGR